MFMDFIPLDEDVAVAETFSDGATLAEDTNEWDKDHAHPVNTFQLLTSFLSNR